jgi:hypothetical protein
MEGISTSLTIQFVFALLTVLTLALRCFKTASAQTSFSYDGQSYNCSSNINCLGHAHVYTGENAVAGITDGTLSLINETSYKDAANTAGIAYYNSPIRFLNLTSGQSISFNTSFTISNRFWVNNSATRGDGMAFVLSGDNSTLGSPGASLGFFDAVGKRPLRSVVIEFDTFQNSGSPEFDISDNHVSVDVGNITWAAAANASDVNVDLTDQGPLYAWVEYSRDTQQLEVRISNRNDRPTNPLLNLTVDLFDVVEEYMWVGFSSSGGNVYSNYYVGAWTFESHWILEPSPVPSPSLTDSKSGSSNFGVIVGASVGVPALLLGSLLIALVVRRRRALSSPGQGASTGSVGELASLEGMPQRFTYKQLSVATDGFSEATRLGRRGFGSVYRGVLPTTGIAVAVKKISDESRQGEKEFMAEVSIISQLSHRNLIQLLGWCSDAGDHNYMLVYELMPNGSLEKFLYGPPNRPCLSWSQRFNILKGTAAAIEYLHQGWKEQVIHRDIKSSNIMLDEKWNPKLGDFGLARRVDHEKQASTTMMAGTYGYIAPEIGATGIFTDKTDIFAFGAVVFEIACGRKVLDSTHVPDDEMVLVGWVWRCFNEGKLLSAVDKRLEDYESKWMEVVLKVGLLCSHPNPQARPSMRQVVQILSGEIPVPSVPSSRPDPVFGSDPRQSAATYLLLLATSSIMKV